MPGIPTLLDILSYRRPAFSATDEEFICRYIEPTGAAPDRYGNWILRIGDAPILWSAHTDTVHPTPGRQRLRVRNGIASLRRKRPVTDAKGRLLHDCLGADNGTGVWLLLELIRAGREGLYIFHRDEESGCQGSNYIAWETPEVVEGIEYAIAFDRRGMDGVVTHQMGHRTASDLFAWSLIDALGIDSLRPDDSGLFTDTEVYSTIIPECTNVSVGFERAHSASETQCLDYANRLRDAVVRLDVDRLLIGREPMWYREEMLAGEPAPGWSEPQWNDDGAPDILHECAICLTEFASHKPYFFTGEVVCIDCFEAIMD